MRKRVCNSLTDDVGSDCDGDESLVRMEGSSVRLQRPHAAPHMAKIQVLQRRPLHESRSETTSPHSDPGRAFEETRNCAFCCCCYCLRDYRSEKNCVESREGGIVRSRNGVKLGTTLACRSDGDQRRRGRSEVILIFFGVK